MTHSAPGRSHRNGVSIMRLFEMFPDEEAARIWFERARWPHGRHCPRCGSKRTYACKHAKSPYRCSDCSKYFSAKTGTPLAGSPVPIRKWVFAIYLEATSLKGVSSLKLHRDINVTQKTAWFMLHRIREAWQGHRSGSFTGPVEVDEAYFGGKRKNMSNAKRRELAGTGRGAVGKATVVGAKDRSARQVRAKVVEHADGRTLRRFVDDTAGDLAVVFTDEAAVYQGIPNPHLSVRHSRSEYVRGQVHTNGIESFWSMLKRAYVGTYHHISEKHLDRYVQRFSGGNNIRDLDTITQMLAIVRLMTGKRIKYRELIA